MECFAFLKIEFLEITTLPYKSPHRCAKVLEGLQIPKIRFSEKTNTPYGLGHVGAKVLEGLGFLYSLFQKNLAGPKNIERSYDFKDFPKVLWKRLSKNL